MGLSADEFWELTPRELSALWDAHKQRERTINYRFGLLATLQYGQTRRNGSAAIEPLEWFGDKIEKPVQTPEQIQSQLTAWAAVVNRK